MSSRHISRMSVLQALFASDARGDLSTTAVLKALESNTAALPNGRGDEDRPFSEALLHGITRKREELDSIIEKSAPQWPLEKIALLDRNILRLGLFELLFGDRTSVPPKVALNEAIELAKTFGGESSGRFVNGVLGAVYRDIGSPRKEEAPKGKLVPPEKEYLAGAVVCAVSAGDVRVALVKDPFSMWTLPKTRYLKGELSDAAALRAAAEELGATSASILAPLGEHEYKAHDPTQGAVTRRVGYFVLCSPESASGGGKGRAFAWFNEHELADLPLYDDLRAVIASGMAAARSGCTAP